MSPYADPVQQPAAKVRVKRGTAQQHLLDSAQQLFAERGYRGTTTKDIAQRAGVSENLIFRYFRSKSDLMVASVITPFLTVLQRFSEDWRRNDAFRAKPYQEIVHTFVGEVVDLIDSHHSLARAILNILVERPPEFDTRAVGARFTALLQDMSPELADFLSRRELTSADPGLMLRMGIISAITNVVLLPESYGAEQKGPTKAVSVDELTNFIVYGLQAPPSR
jgi:AcrR family transcriptional regulator